TNRAGYRADPALVRLAKYRDRLGHVPPADPQPASWVRRLLGYCLRHRGDLYGAFGAALAGSLVSVTVPLLIKHVIDLVHSNGSANPSHASITPWVWLLIAAALVQYGLTFLRRFTAG